MQLSEYPAQEPISEFARAYAEKVMQLGANIKGEDVLYGANPYQSLGIHKPLKGCGAVFMFIHGGGWTSGYKEWNNFMAPAFVNNDILFVTVGYRLAPTHLFPKVSMTVQMLSHGFITMLPNTVQIQIEYFWEDILRVVIMQVC